LPALESIDRSRSATPSRRCTEAANRFASSWMSSAARHPVAGVVHSPAVLARDRSRASRALHQVGHDVAQPFDIKGSRDIH
jgi:hypothetical protein